MQAGTWFINSKSNDVSSIFKDRSVARMLPPESASSETLSGAALVHVHGHEEEEIRSLMWVSTRRGVVA